MRYPISRRTLLEVLSAAGVAVYLPACKDGATGDDSSDDTAAANQRVIVLGGGLAGLSAAYELVKLGHEVVVLEAQSRVGGRVHTHREGWADRQYVELGATRIPDVHDHTLGYVEELGLTLSTFQSGDPLYYLNGQRFIHQSGEGWPLDMTEEEQANGLDMWSTYIAAYFADFGNPRDGSFPAPGVVDAYDGMTWTDFLLSKGCSADWLRLYTADNGSEISKIGCLAWMAAEVADQDWGDTFHVDGGNDLIVSGLAELLGDAVRLERVITRIEHSETGVVITATHDGAEETYEGAHCVCAIPFTILRNIEISPAFSDDKMQCIQELYMMPSSRGWFQTRSRFWQSEGIGGLKICKTDTAAERIWDLSNVLAGSSGMVMAYTQHLNAQALSAVAEDGRQEYLLGIIDDFLPDLRDEVTGFVSKSWEQDEWVMGAWTDILPDQWWMFTVIGRPEGRVHFAGEHTSIWAGWMQGAIESGKRCAQEIHQG